MAIHKRNGVLVGSKAYIWMEVEAEAGIQYEFAVEPTRGFGYEHAAWLRERGITGFWSYSRFAIFFVEEGDAALFYLVWGCHGNS